MHDPTSSPPGTQRAVPASTPSRSPGGMFSTPPHPRGSFSARPCPRGEGRGSQEGQAGCSEPSRRPGRQARREGGTKSGRDGPGIGSPGPGRDVPAAVNEPAGGEGPLPAVCCSPNIYTASEKAGHPATPQLGEAAPCQSTHSGRLFHVFPNVSVSVAPRAQDGRRGGDGAGRSCSP